MKVYIVIEVGLHEGSTIKIVFSSAQGAQEYIDKQPKTNWCWYEYEEWEVK